MSMSGPVAGSNETVKPGMRKKSEIDDLVRHKLDRKQLIGKPFVSCRHRFPRALEKADNLAFPEQGVFTGVTVQQVGKHIPERFVIPVDCFLYGSLGCHGGSNGQRVEGSSKPMNPIDSAVPSPEIS